jgi:NADH oxidase (H2O2-forming)
LEIDFMVEHIVIIGCGAAGATAALQARKFNRSVAIFVFNSENYSQYSRCGLPYTVSGKVKDFNDLVLMPPENWSGLNIDTKLGTSVLDIDHQKRELTYEGTSGK